MSSNGGSQDSTVITPMDGLDLETPEGRAAAEWFLKENSRRVEFWARKFEAMEEREREATARYNALLDRVEGLTEAGHRTLDAVAALRERLDESIDQDARILVKLSEIHEDNALIKSRLNIVEREGSSPGLEKKFADLAFEEMNTGLKMKTLAIMEEERKAKARAKEEEEAHALAMANRKRFWDLFWKAAALLVMTLVGYAIAKLTGR